jgi:hypothetical protein
MSSSDADTCLHKQSATPQRCTWAARSQPACGLSLSYKLSCVAAMWWLKLLGQVQDYSLMRHKAAVEVQMSESLLAAEEEMRCRWPSSCRKAQTSTMCSSPTAPALGLTRCLMCVSVWLTASRADRPAISSARGSINLSCRSGSQLQGCHRHPHQGARECCCCCAHGRCPPKMRCLIRSTPQSLITTWPCLAFVQMKRQAISAGTISR